MPAAHAARTARSWSLESFGSTPSTPATARMSHVPRSYSATAPRSKFTARLARLTTVRRTRSRSSVEVISRLISVTRARSRAVSLASCRLAARRVALRDGHARNLGQSPERVDLLLAEATVASESVSHAGGPSRGHRPSGLRWPPHSRPRRQRRRRRPMRRHSVRRGGLDSPQLRRDTRRVRQEPGSRSRYRRQRRRWTRPQAASRRSLAGVIGRQKLECCVVQRVRDQRGNCGGPKRRCAGNGRRMNSSHTRSKIATGG